MAGPTDGVFTSPQWSDNVARMYKFAAKHPEVIITTPMQNESDDFIAKWPDGTARDRSLGWLMDKLEEEFRGR